MLPEQLQENELAAALAAHYPAAITGAEFAHGELTLRIEPDDILAVLEFFKRQQQFERLSTVTAVDRYPLEPRFEIVYHLQSVARNLRVRLKASVAGEISSATAVYAAANWYEREVFDLFGVVFSGHPNPKRIMMPDDWDGYPLRRDFPTHGFKYTYGEQQ